MYSGTNTKKPSLGKYIKAELTDSDIPLSASLKLRIIGLKLYIENSILRFFTRILFRPATHPKKILVFRTGSLGDSINAIPALHAIKDTFPDAQIDILTNAGLKNLVGMRYLLDKNLYHEIIDYYGMPKRELFRFLKEKQYDCVIQLPQANAVFHRVLRDLLVFRGISKSGIGWYTSHTGLFRKTQAKYLMINNEHEKLLAHLRQAGFKTNQLTPILNPSNADKEFVQHLLHENGLNDGKKKLCVVIGAKRPQNRWPIGYFKVVIEHFAPSVHILLIGSQEDRLLAEPLLGIQHVHNFCGLLTPMQSAAMFGMSDLTLSNDTGPMHMSYAVSTPTIAIFSARDLPGKWYPPVENNLVLRAKGIACEACMSEVCHNNICMQAILPEQVIEAVEHFLDKV